MTVDIDRSPGHIVQAHPLKMSRRALLKAAALSGAGAAGLSTSWIRETTPAEATTGGLPADARGPETEKRVPGTWVQTVTFPGGGENVTRAILTFTSDGSVVEKIEPLLEGSLGVWEVRHGENEFRFMLFRFQHDLTVTEPPAKEDKEVVTTTFTRILRFRSTNHLVDDNRFSGGGMVDFLDAAGKLLPTPGFHTTHDAVRMQLVPE